MAKRGRAGLTEEQLRQLFDAAVVTFQSVGESAGLMFTEIASLTSISEATVKKYVSQMGLYADGSWQWEKLKAASVGDAFTLTEVEKKPVARSRKTDKPAYRAATERTISVVAQELEEVRAEIARADELKAQEAALVKELSGMI